MDILSSAVSSVIVCCAVCAAVAALAPKRSAEGMRILAALALLVTVASPLARIDGFSENTGTVREELTDDELRTQTDERLRYEARRATKALVAQSLAGAGLDDYEIYVDTEGDAENGINVTRVRIYLNGDSGQLQYDAARAVEESIGLKPEIYIGEEVD